jgi:hypothetical protein
MERLEQQGMVRDWVAWVHNDHSSHSHVHVLAWSERRWTREDLAEAREAASREWDRAYERGREVEERASERER